MQSGGVEGENNLEISKKKKRKKERCCSCRPISTTDAAAAQNPTVAELLFRHQEIDF